MDENELHYRVNRMFGAARDWHPGILTDLVVIGNGYVKPEGAPIAPWTTAEEIADRTLFTIGSLFPHAKTQRVVWRRYPQLESYQDFGPPCPTCGHASGSGVAKQKITLRLGVEPL